MSDDQTTADDAADAPADKAQQKEQPVAGGDKTLTCEECGKDFIFTAGEQEFYEEKGFTPPKRCPDCRAAKKAAGRQFTKVTCAGCGKETEVPFVPSGDRPVYCRECFEAQNR
ncbi:zinc-ribbon domain containing protein [Patescibacteria group bacterium]|nr:zinc-ribbon domain containing protein [Patescibacteria group bacterium]